MGKYRKYGRRRKQSKKRLKRVLSLLSILISLFYLFIAVYGSIQIEGKLLEFSIVGTRVVNTTLFRVTYVGPSENTNFTIKLNVGDESADFVVPGGPAGRTIKPGVSKIIKVEREIIQPNIVILGEHVNVTYPAPHINTSIIGRAEDYVLSHYPLELYFIFTTQICNVSVRAQSIGASLTEAKFIYGEGEGVRSEVPLYCSGDSCEITIVSRCITSYDLVSELTYLGFLRLRYESGRTVFRFIDNLWLPASMAAITLGVILIVFKKVSGR
ncbi:MAG: hypothetical protein QW780_02460 [Sulfolobales archaeon]